MDMETIVKVLQERVGLSEEKARMAVDVVLEQVRKAVPPQYAGLVDSVLGEHAAAGATQAAEGAESGSGLVGFLRGLGR